MVAHEHHSFPDTTGVGLGRLATRRELHGDRQLEPAVDLVLPDDAIEVRSYPPLHVARSDRGSALPS